MFLHREDMAPAVQTVRWFDNNKFGGLIWVGFGVLMGYEIGFEMKVLEGKFYSKNTKKKFIESGMI